jgi:hypothetical protein
MSMNSVFDKQCYITTRDKLYLCYSNTDNCFSLNDTVNKSCLFNTYSLEKTSLFCNKVSYIRHSDTTIYLNDEPSANPIPLLVAYDHCSQTCLEEALYHEQKWKYENRIIHNIAGETLCYKDGLFYFQYREYDKYEDNTPYLLYIELNDV